MGACGGKKAKKTETKDKMKPQEKNNIEKGGVKTNNEQNIIAKINVQDVDILKQQQQDQVKIEPQNKPVENQTSQSIQDRNKKQKDHHMLSEIMPKPEIPNNTPIILLSKKKFQDDDPAKHHLEV